VDALRPGPVPSRPAASAEPPPVGTDERALVAAVLRKDRKATAQFVAAHIDAVYAYTRHRLTPRTWLIAIARHKIEDLYRQQLRSSVAFDELDVVDEQLLSELTSLDEQIDTARVRAKARYVLARMPERYGLILLWRYWEQRSTREMALAIGTTEKSVERTLARARTRFKELWLRE
jgi:RNA polymerase sigma factor (sigma-70 family)